MIYCFKANYNNKKISSLTLLELLKNLEFKIKKYHWSMYKLWAFAKESSELDMPSLEEKIFELPTGLHMNWDELIEQLKILIKH